MDGDQFEVIEPDPPKRSWFRIAVIVGMVAMVAYGLYTVQCAPAPTQKAVK